MAGPGRDATVAADRTLFDIHRCRLIGDATERLRGRAGRRRRLTDTDDRGEHTHRDDTHAGLRTGRLE